MWFYCGWADLSSSGLSEVGCGKISFESLRLRNQGILRAILDLPLSNAPSGVK